MKRKMTWLILIPLVLTAFWFVSTSRAATETPEYKVIRTDGKIEIRDYTALTIATTPMAEDGMNGGFGQLFRFITGNNESKEKIEMTSPVLITTAADKKTMSFIMPKGTAEKGVPKPAGETVTLGKLDAARFVAWRFSGERSTENEKAAIAAINAWLLEQKIEGKGQPMFAYYDPPWTPIPMRRNEVMIQIEKGE
ncbi:heme-binding protein [soil metagenome]